ncbi:MAG: DNA repair protein RecN [Deltaproteobacteria bacterium]|nr:DNA repair protein RecN [Deltaproteobacteria bacterium]
MLRELRIKNFAVIDEMALEFGPGLNVLTGETGAGKTLVLNALGLVTGGRTSSDVIRQGEEEASVEALFEALPEAVREKLKEGGYRDDDELVAKRVVSRSGKNRVYLGGGLCPLGLLAEVGSGLIHIYGQHEHQALLRPEAHLALLDSHGGLEEKLEEMKRKHDCVARDWERLRDARMLIDKRREEEALLRAQLEEILQARLKEGEDEELKERRNILIHSEKLYQGCKEGEEILYEGDDALVGRLGRYVQRLREVASIDAALHPVVELLSASLAQMEEATSALRRYTDRVQYDPETLETLEDRLAEIGRLKRKYNGSIGDILRIQEHLSRELSALTRTEEEIPNLTKALDESRRSAWELAESLSVERRRIARRLKREMETEAEGLGMPGIVFEVHFQEPGPEQDETPFQSGGKQLTKLGMDQVEFFFSSNPGEEPKPLAKIASGGELSRLMLAIKSLVMVRGDIPTLLFDEVDAGIGGRVAEMVGKKLKKVAASHQVICVTHLPQIAALANSHYAVSKETVKGRSFTEVKKLGPKERIAEIARMLGGVKITDKTRQHAEEMVKRGSLTTD